MEENELKLLVDFHKGADRQGPGSDEQTKKALKTALDTIEAGCPKIADIGCGTGAQTLVLAEQTQGNILAIDLFPAFLETLRARAREAGVDKQITTRAASMDALDIEAASLDIIWSEGAVYIMGFEEGVNYWRQFLKPGGILALTEIAWLSDERPKEIENHWESEYAQMGNIAKKMSELRQAGYEVSDHFVLPAECWTENYYKPIQARMDRFLAKHKHAEAATRLMEAEKHEIALYEKYGDYFGYVFFVGKKIE